MANSYLRGHRIEEHNGEWYYSDTKESTVETWEEKPCGYCNQHNTIEGHDACLGTVPGVMNACCGHGQQDDAYIQFDDGTVVDGEEAIKIQVEELHNQAMDLAEEAFIAKRKGDADNAIRLFLQALEIEVRVASGFPLEEKSEPTRSILYRSAASMAYHAGKYERAEQLVANGLAGFPPIEIKEELRELHRQLKK